MSRFICALIIVAICNTAEGFQKKRITYLESYESLETINLWGKVGEKTAYLVNFTLETQDHKDPTKKVGVQYKLKEEILMTTDHFTVVEWVADINFFIDQLFPLKYWDAISKKDPSPFSVVFLIDRNGQLLKIQNCTELLPLLIKMNELKLSVVDKVDEPFNAFQKKIINDAIEAYKKGDCEAVNEFFRHSLIAQFAFFQGLPYRTNRAVYFKLDGTDKTYFYDWKRRGNKKLIAKKLRKNLVRIEEAHHSKRARRDKMPRVIKEKLSQKKSGEFAEEVALENKKEKSIDELKQTLSLSREEWLKRGISADSVDMVMKSVDTLIQKGIANIEALKVDNYDEYPEMIRRLTYNKANNRLIKLETEWNLKMQGLFPGYHSLLRRLVHIERIDP